MSLSRSNSGSQRREFTEFICPSCPIVRPNEGSLEAHILDEHMDWLPYECLSCKKKRATVEQIIEHNLAVHAERNPKVLYIPDLAKKAQLKALLDEARFKQFEAYYSANSPAATTTTNSTPSPSGSNDSDFMPKVTPPVTRQATGKRLAPSDAQREVISPAPKRTPVNDKKRQPILQSTNSAFKQIAANIASAKSLKPVNDDKESLSESYSDLDSPPPPFDPKDKEYKPSRQSSSTKRTRKSREVAEDDCKECSMCSVLVMRCHRNSHVYKHLFESKNICRYWCSNCDYKLYRKIDVDNHIRRVHKDVDEAECLDKMDEEMQREFDEAHEEYFGEGSKPTGEKMDDEIVEITPAKKRVNADRQHTSTPLTNETSDEEQSASATNTSRAREPLFKYCALCEKTLDLVQINSLQKHASLHVRQLYGLSRYKCGICEFETPYRSTLITHCKKEHKSPLKYVDNILKWTPEIVKDVSQLCFADPNYVLERMPRIWWQHHIDDREGNDEDHPVVVITEDKSSQQNTDVSEAVECKVCCKRVQSVINHFAMHMRDWHNTQRFSCKYCNYAAVEKSTIQKHGLREHGKGLCYQDNIIHWDIAAMKETSKKMFDNSEFIFTRMPYEWFPKKEAQRQQTPSTSKNA